MTSFDDAKRNILENFDFNKVAKVMHLFDWKYASLGHVPDEAEIREFAKSLIDDVAQNGGAVSSGGFTASVNDEEGNTVLELSFVLESKGDYV